MWAVVYRIYNSNTRLYAVQVEDQEAATEKLRKEMVATEKQLNKSHDTKYQDQPLHVIHINLRTNTITKYVPDVKLTGGKFIFSLVESKEVTTHE